MVKDVLMHLIAVVTLYKIMNNEVGWAVKHTITYHEITLYYIQYSLSNTFIKSIFTLVLHIKIVYKFQGLSTCKQVFTFVGWRFVVVLFENFT